MAKLLVAGAGKIGKLIACLLAEQSDFDVTLSDVAFSKDIKTSLGRVEKKIKLQTVDVSAGSALRDFVDVAGFDAVISSLPYYLNTHVAQVARDANLHYFDLTEDTQVTEAVRTLAEGASTAFVPQSGLAPGFISIVANDLVQKFDRAEAVLLRTGALPIRPNNALKYALTWSTEGLLNEYANPCFAIEDNQPVSLPPLEGLETIVLDGTEYEAFNTSGGLGSLAETYQDRVERMNYKTLRYPGHCAVMRLLMNDLKMRNKQAMLKEILEDAVPRTNQDVVVVYVACRGHREGQLFEESFVKKVYPKHIAGRDWSAIQITTASSVCAVADMVLSDPGRYQGFVRQEAFSLEAFLNNRFGQHYSG